MNDPTNTRLTSQFGHSSQELINLSLTGHATSNVFDDVLTLLGSLGYGIQNHPAVGYLTQLELLRYCEVPKGGGRCDLFPQGKPNGGVLQEVDGALLGERE